MVGEFLKACLILASLLWNTILAQEICDLHWKQVLLTKWETQKLDVGAKVNIRLHNYPETMIALKNLKAAYIGKT